VVGVVVGLGPGPKNFVVVVFTGPGGQSGIPSQREAQCRSLGLRA
jgi:hypothetical protein